MEQETRDQIERLFVIKQKIKNLKAQADAIEDGLPSLAETGTKIEFPATHDRPGFTVWQQTFKKTVFEQEKMHDAYWFATSTGDDKTFLLSVKAADLKKVREGKSRMDAQVAGILLSAATTNEGSPSWRFKAEGDDDADEE